LPELSPTVEAVVGPLKATVVPLPTDCGLMVPERRKVFEELEPCEASPLQPQRSANNASAASLKAWYFRRLLDFGSVQRRDRRIE
jgi:hypothetical protein